MEAERTGRVRWRRNYVASVSLIYFLVRFYFAGWRFFLLSIFFFVCVFGFAGASFHWWLSANTRYLLYNSQIKCTQAQKQTHKHTHTAHKDPKPCNIHPHKRTEITGIIHSIMLCVYFYLYLADTIKFRLEVEWSAISVRDRKIYATHYTNTFCHYLTHSLYQSIFADLMMRDSKM